ncbi:coiled-coil domain-containing protein 175 [Macrotis lagotis]|uniref:coiled-coil domain-containing protein 175 n=1 Tax=Macrotis lagotis TaxID=92651 RepID=UPI003D683F2A
MDDSLCPLSLGSSVALAVLEKLFEVEKTLKNEKFQFNEEAKTVLEDVAEAVKKLECMRKTTIDLLEIESIEISRLRFILWHLPGNITKEIKDAVLAARNSNANEIRKLRIAIKKKRCEMELLNKQLSFLEKTNSDLREEQEKIAEEHQKRVLSVNMKMIEKAENSISKKELYNQIRCEKEEIAYYQGLLKSLNKELDSDRQQFTKKKEKLKKIIADTKIIKDEEIKKSLKKKKELAEMLNETEEIEKEMKYRLEVITDQVEEEEELEDGMKKLQEQFEEDLRQPEKLEKKKLDYMDLLEEMARSSKLNQEELQKSIRQATGRLSKIMAQNDNLKGKSKVLMEQLTTALQEEKDSYFRKKATEQIIDKQDELITEKRIFLTKRLTDIKTLQDSIDKLRNLYKKNTESHNRQIEFQKEKWMNGSQKSAVNQWKTVDIQKQHENWMKTEEEKIEEISQKVEYVEKIQIEITKESANYDDKIIKHEEKIKKLSEEIKEEEQIFLQVEQDSVKELKVLEENCITQVAEVKEKENELEIFIPQVKMVQVEYEENIKEFETLKNQISEQNYEQESLNLGIGMMKIQTRRYANNREYLKIELKKYRTKELVAMEKRLSDICTTENSIFEIDQKRRLLILENYRIRKALKELKKDVDYFTTKGQNDFVSMQKMNLELIELQGIYAEMWEETLKAVKRFKECNKFTLQEIIKLIQQFYMREDKMKIIYDWLTQHVDNLNYIIDYKDSNTNIIKKTVEEKTTQVTTHKTMRKGTETA